MSSPVNGLYGHSFYLQCLRYPYFQVGQNLGSQLNRPTINPNPNTPPLQPPQHQQQSKPTQQFQPLQENKGHNLNRPHISENKVDNHSTKSNLVPKQFDKPVSSSAILFTCILQHCPVLTECIVDKK